MPSQEAPHHEHNHDLPPAGRAFAGSPTDRRLLVAPHRARRATPWHISQRVLRPARSGRRRESGNRDLPAQSALVTRPLARRTSATERPRMEAHYHDGTSGNPSPPASNSLLLPVRRGWRIPTPRMGRRAIAVGLGRPARLSVAKGQADSRRDHGHMLRGVRSAVKHPPSRRRR